MIVGRSTFLCVVCNLLMGWNVVDSTFSCDLISNGGYIQRQVTIGRLDSPCEIKKDLTIMEGSTLTLKPGTTLIFNPSVTLGVNGTLIAKGTANERITFTKSSTNGDNPRWPEDIRLVDDFSVHVGRLELMHEGRWRGVCAKFVNWTQSDVNVACRQLGFETGNFSFQSWARNHSRYMLYGMPMCTGEEASVKQCPGYSRVKVGPRICWNQRTIHLKCIGMSPGNPARNTFWSGIEFYNTTIQKVINGHISTNESTSVLQFVDILYAGLAKDGNATPSLRASPHAPHLINVRILHSALDATNFTNIFSTMVIHNSTFANNRGHGVAVESHMGHVRLTDNLVTSNHGNGVKVKFLDGRYVVYDKEATFCQVASLFLQTFPLFIHGLPNLSNQCGKKFTTMIGERLTLNVLEMDIEPGYTAKLVVHDGTDSTYPILGTYDVINGTLPMGVTSTFHNIFIKFVWSPPVYRPCETLKTCVKFTIIIDSHVESSAEFFMNNTLVTTNLQHGVFIENVRNYVVVNASNITHNMYGAGLRVYGGAGDVLVNASLIEYNMDNGVNLTTEGGWRMFNRSSFNFNIGNGVNITFNETSIDNKTRYARHQRTEVSFSTFIGNQGHGLSVGNFCRSALHVVNDSQFIHNHKNGIQFLSCYNIIPKQNISNITIGYNMFRGNHDHAIQMSPLLNAVGRIANNTFTQHHKRVMLIDNTDDFRRLMYTQGMPVEYEVEGNRFHANSGQYVAFLRLCQGSALQKLIFRYNVLENNMIKSGMDGLNERMRSHAVMIVSSDNVVVRRNQLTNPESTYEISTHLLEMNSNIQATEQWWGTTNYSLLINRIFDQAYRYNLARILYHPSLEYNWLYGPVLTDRNIELEVDFQRGVHLGGRLTSEFTTKPYFTYYVDRDISVKPLGNLIVSPGTVFEFGNSLGMLVQGQVQFDGTAGNPIIMKMRNESSASSSSSSSLSFLSSSSSLLDPTIDGTDNETYVRLVDGTSDMEGRLEVRRNTSHPWSTVCDQGWTFRDSSVACNMLGYVINVDDWKVKVNVPGSHDMGILMSHVDCHDMDVDLMSCDSEEEHSCDHSHDVYLRCHMPAWSGVRFLGSASSSRMSHVVIEGAGVNDPSVPIYVPALKIDYNVHALNHLHVRDNVHDGIQIMKNDVYAGCHLHTSIISNNQGVGLSIRDSFFHVDNCIFTNNSKSGIEYNPTMTSYEALQVRTGVHKYIALNGSKSIQLKDHEVIWVMTEKQYAKQLVSYQIEFQVTRHFRVMLDLVDYNPDTSEEQVMVYESRASAIHESTRKWVVDDDVIDFPVVSQMYFLTVRWSVSGVASGRLAFVVRSKQGDWSYPLGRISLTHNQLDNNKYGIISNMYNQPSDEYLSIFHRFNWEKVDVRNCTFISNKYGGLVVMSHTKYNPLYLPSSEELETALRIAEMSYRVHMNTFIRNGGGVVATHVGFGFSNNVWIWEVQDNTFKENQAGGLFIEFPRVNLMFTELFNHSININGTQFLNNEDFEFVVGGFYCNGSISSNRFQYNKCRRGCIELSGTEKDFEFRDNYVSNNMGRYMLEINMNSHTPFTEWVDSTVVFNRFENNESPMMKSSSSSSPPSYAVGVRGLQNITINRNIINNPLMTYELLGGQAASKLENYLDVTENWWGTTNQAIIQDRLIDFDDWNNFAIAEYIPFLMEPSFESKLSTESKLRRVIDLTKPLGGRVTESLKLPYRPQPYVVERDLTIMEGFNLVIDEGVTMQFHPGVGVLVLGSLSAYGSVNRKITFEPIDKSQVKSNRVKRSQAPSQPRLYIHPDLNPKLGYEMRLRGGESEDGGFLEIYNNTELRWSIVCDDAFNDKTAEVACKTMGKEHSNVVVERSRFYDIFVLGYQLMHEQEIEWFWRETMICDGSEEDLIDCKRRLNYDLSRCMLQGNYVYMRCGPRNLASNFDYWGNIRFSSPSFESDYTNSVFSRFYHVDMYGAGVLHGEKVAAVQSLYQAPDSKYVKIQNSAWNGYDYIAPSDQFSIVDGVITNNNGYAVGILVLNGQTSDGDSQFVSLENSEMPQNLHGTIRMCTAEKFIHVNKRALVYYRYSFDTIDCIKIIRSQEPHKQIGFRLLQFNLFNDSIYTNAVELYDGEFFSPMQSITKLTFNSSVLERKKFYTTSSRVDTLGIRITASPAYGGYGFVAEVLTLPISSSFRPDFGVNQQQTISRNNMANNLRGGVVYRSVGENNPRIVIEKNHVVHCGLKVLNNTFPGVVDVFVQNTRLLTISNNFICNNAGGITVNTTTKGSDSSIYANITNNLIMRNTHGEPLHLEGHHFQKFHVTNNYLSHNDVQFRNIISAFGLQMNFTSNVIVKNVAQCILNASINEKIDINQRYMYNSIYNNHAFAYNRSTICLKSAKFQFSHNFLLNPYNVFEMVTFNRTKYPDGMHPKVSAENNWWGRNHKSYVSGRIWDRLDDDNFIGVNFEPFITDNSTLLDGKCYPGWRQYNKKCYMYFGGVTPYDQAVAICRANNGRMAWARDPSGRERYLGELVARFQFNYNVDWRTWVFKDSLRQGSCSYLRDYKVEESDCFSLLPFICEKDPFIQPKMNWLPIIITLVFSSLIIFFIIIPILIFCCIKSAQRKVEKVDRKDTLERSLHASRQSLNSLSASRQSLDVINKSYMTDDSRRKRPLLKDDMSSSSSYHKKADDSSSDLIIKTDFRDDHSYFSDSTDKTFSKYTPYHPNMPPHVENEIPLIDYTHHERPTSRQFDYNDDESKKFFSSFSSGSSVPKPKPRSGKRIYKPPLSVIEPDANESYSSSDEIPTKPPTKTKPARPKLKPLNESEM